MSQGVPGALATLLTAGLTLGAAAQSPSGAPSRDLRDLWPAEPHVTDLRGTPISAATLQARLSEPLWVVRVQAAWCGTCQWHAAWTPALAARYAGRVAVVDLLIADAENQPPDVAAGRSWQDLTEDRTITLVAANRGRLDVLFPDPAPLPRVVLVDARTRAVAAVLANPSPDRLLAAIDEALGSDRGPAQAAPALVDGRFTGDQWALIEGMRVPAESPPDPTNRVADDPAAAAFGFHLFFDKLLSPASVACSSCHNAERLFTDGQAVPNDGTGHARRNMPTVLLTGLAQTQLWDGRADTLWGQAVMPFEDQTEMGSSRLFVAHAIRSRHWGSYEAVFGPLPDLDDRARFPAQGGPGSPEWERMRPADRDAVSRVFANVGKAIAAFERSLRVLPGPLDRYAAGELDALDDEAKDGLAAFLEAGCAQCHFGPRLANDAFHNLRFATGRRDGAADLGRLDGLPVLLESEFTGQGPFSDARIPARRIVPGDHALGAFKTPSLRGAVTTAPYGHGGSFGTLASVVGAHRTGGLPPDDPRAAGTLEPWARGFDPAFTPRIVRFLNSLPAAFRQARRAEAVAAAGR